MAYSNDLRQKLLQAADRHPFSQARLAEILGVSLSWVKGVWRRQTGSAALRPLAPGQRPKLTDQQNEQARQFVRADTEATLRALQRWLEATPTVRLRLPSGSRLLTRLERPRPKSHSMRPNATRRRSRRSARLGAGR